MPRNEKSSGVSLSNLLQELHVNEQSYGCTSLEVASTYNAIGLFHCRLYKDYNGALHYHTKALRIINTLHQQQQLQDALAHDRSEVASDCFKSATIIAARKVESHARIIPLLVTTYMDIGTCYELQQNFNMAIQYYEKTDRTIIRLEQQSYDSCSSKIKTIIPKHITFACRRAIARVKRL
jgi:tetratricopeptide (TPR) repeat protein